MPIEQIHDARVLANELVPWLERTLGWREVSVGGFDQPAEAGGSNETRFIDVHWTDPEPRAQRFILRIEPTMNQLFLDPSLERQCLLLDNLKGQGLPVPEVFAFESDPGVLGAPFAVMECVAGYIPSPSYNTAGWLFDAPPEIRRELWLHGLAALVEIGNAAVDEMGFLARPTYGGDPIDQELHYTLASLRWATSGTPAKGLEALWADLAASRPDFQPRLSWGDARVGNVIFQDTSVAAVIDWEQASLSGSLVDLGWWLFFDVFHSTERGVARLEGLPDRSETLDRWVALGGVEPTDIDWYERFAGLRLATIFARVLQLAEERGDNEFADSFRARNPAIRILEAMNAI